MFSPFRFHVFNPLSNLYLQGSFKQRLYAYSWRRRVLFFNSVAALHYSGHPDCSESPSATYLFEKDLQLGLEI